MGEAAESALALACNFIGVVWLALAMRVHWAQVFSARQRTPRARLLLRILGAAALFVSFLLMARASHISMAPLVWFMSLAGSALIVAMTLAWRPRALGPLAPWLIRPKAR